MRVSRAYLAAAVMVLALAGCRSRDPGRTGAGLMKTELFGERKNAFGNVEAPADFDWQQCEGVILDFIVENNINANIFSKEVDKFTKVTGIKVNIKSMDFNTMTEKINMEFIAKTGQYELIYVDPYQTLTRFHDSLEDLSAFERAPDIPHIVGGLDSFSPEQTEVCSYFGSHGKLCAVPFDSTTMILFYRKDIFEKYGDAMERDLGYRPRPGDSAFTWERYIQVSQWISAHVPEEEVRYGSITMSAAHNSVYTEFSNVLSSEGGDYFAEPDMSMLGAETGGEILSNTAPFFRALDIYKRICELNPETAGALNWEEGAALFAGGDAAMMMNWDENAAVMENPKLSEVAGKVGYGILPFGSVRSANIYGGSGIGINHYISDEKKLASWLFIVWATSPQIQMDTFLEEEGGNMPTRRNLNQLIIGQYMAKLPHSPAAISAQKKSYAYYRPKLGDGYAFENILITSLNDMVKKDLDPASVADRIHREWQAVNEAGGRP